MLKIVLAVVTLALLAAALLGLPAADPVRVSALSVPKLLASESPNEQGVLQPVGDQILDGPSVRRGDDGELILWLGGVRMGSTIYPSEDLDVHGLARRTLISGLRQFAAARGEALAVQGELMPSPGGLSVLASLQEAGFEITASSADGHVTRGSIADWNPAKRTSLFPPLIAIALAVLFRRPILALFAGVWTATFLLRMGAEHTGTLSALARSLPDVATDLFWPQLSDPTRQQIMGFVFLIMAMVGVMTRGGGIRGLMDLVARLASNARRTQIATWVMGLVIFFDDYANCILVGTTMRPLSDRFKIAREKLAYLVDSTAAPVAGLSIFSTWIAFEVSTFSAQLPAAGLLPKDGYAIFVETLPFRFYSILTLVMSCAIAFSGRDFGPMLSAERRARRTGQLVRPGGRPMVSDAGTHMEPFPGVLPRARNALLPLLVFIGLTMFEILRVGFGAMRAVDASVSFSTIFTIEGITTLLGDGESTRALLIGSAGGLGVAVALAAASGLGLEILRAAWTTLRSMSIAVAILYLAWMIGAACDLLSTAAYLTAVVGEHMAPELLPAILFLISAAVAFATGSSWSTMSILLPLVVGLSYSLGARIELGGHVLMVMSIGAVLEGSIFGDHCSPISDTTVLSSTASASDHIDHVRTQIPYALTVMLIALSVGYLPCAFAGQHPLVSLACAAALVLVIVFVFGRKADQPVDGRPAAL